MSPAETRLWNVLRTKPNGYKFRRQFPQAGFSVDFACLSTRLGIEVDGESHDRGDQPQFDEWRDARLNEPGFMIMRIPAYEVFNNLEGVLLGILEQCRMLGPLHHPAAPGGPPPRSGEEL
jgi:very-short-patch-repair endonuclease